MRAYNYFYDLSRLPLSNCFIIQISFIWGATTLLYSRMPPSTLSTPSTPAFSSFRSARLESLPAVQLRTILLLRSFSSWSRPPNRGIGIFSKSSLIAAYLNERAGRTSTKQYLLFCSGSLSSLSKASTDMFYSGGMLTLSMYSQNEGQNLE